MKKLLLFVYMMLLASTYALYAQVTFDFKVGNASSFTIPVPNGSNNFSFTVTLSKPHSQVLSDGSLRVYAKPTSGNNILIFDSKRIVSADWTYDGSSKDFIRDFSGVFALTPNQLNNLTGAVFIQLEQDNNGTPYKSTDVTATVPVFNNSITAPAVTSFPGAGNPGVISGTTPQGGNGTYAYQWESSTTSASSGYSNITVNGTGITYDPPAFAAPTSTITTYYRRKVTSGTNNTGTSNAISITKSPEPLANNTIFYFGTTTFLNSGDPSGITGSTPTGGNGIYAYQWQSARLDAPTNFTDIPSATSMSYDPPTVYYTTYFRRKVTSGTAPESISNIITISINRPGTNMSNPIDIGNFGMCQTYSTIGYNYPEYGYGNDYGNSTDDIFYRFNLTTAAKVFIANCKTDGVTGPFYLLDTSGNRIVGTYINDFCDYGGREDFILQPGVYYIVTEGPGGIDPTNYLPIYLSSLPVFTVSPQSTTIALGSSVTLTATGTSDLTYYWSPPTGLSTTTGASVVASPAFTTRYGVSARSPQGCSDYKEILVNVVPVGGSTFDNPIVANIGGCGYSSGSLSPVGYGNDYGGPGEDVFFKFTLASASEVSFDVGATESFDMHLVLLNSTGGFIDEQYYKWIDIGDDAGTKFYVLPDGTPLKPTLPAGTYYVVVEGSGGVYVGVPGPMIFISRFSVSIETPAGYGCRQASSSMVGITQAIPHNITGSNVTRVDGIPAIVVYPNPANDQLTVLLETDGAATIEFTNANGARVKQSITDNTGSVSIGDLPAGLYLLKISQGQRIYNKKLLIRR